MNGHMNFWVQLIYIPYLSSGKSFSSSSEELLYGRAFQIEFNYSNWMFVWIHNGGYERKKSDKPQFMTKRQIHIPRNVVIVGTICMQLPRQRWAAMTILVTVTNGEHIFVQQNYHWAGVSVIYSTTLNFERGNE